MILTVLALLIGTLCVFWGYRLLMRGVYADPQSNAIWSDRPLLVKRGTPGVTFAVFGAAMIVLPLMHSKHFRTRPAAATAVDTVQEQNESKATSVAPPKRNLAAKPRSSSANSAQPANPSKSRYESDFFPQDANDPPATKVYKPGRV